MKLYIGNLPVSVSDHELENLFASVGAVQRAEVFVDRETGRSRGFGFVEMNNEQDVIDAICTLNGKVIEGRAIAIGPVPQGIGSGSGAPVLNDAGIGLVEFKQGQPLTFHLDGEMLVEAKHAPRAIASSDASFAPYAAEFQRGAVAVKQLASEVASFANELRALNDALESGGANG